MEIVAVRPVSMVESLANVRRTPLNHISADQAANIVRQIMSRQGTRHGSVDVARFGSAV